MRWLILYKEQFRPKSPGENVRCACHARDECPYENDPRRRRNSFDRCQVIQPLARLAWSEACAGSPTRKCPLNQARRLLPFLAQQLLQHFDVFIHAFLPTEASAGSVRGGL